VDGFRTFETSVWQDRPREKFARMSWDTRACESGRANDPLAKLQAGPHANATRRVACRD